MALTSRKKTGHHRTKHYAIISSQGIRTFLVTRKAMSKFEINELGYNFS
jgi:hypothetical protein